MLPDVLTYARKAYFLQIRQDLIAVCSEAPDPRCAGAILGLFEYWTRVKLAHKTQAEIDNAIARKERVEPTQDTSLWVYKTEQEMRTETLNLFGPLKLRDNREWLVEKGYLEKRNNPKFRWDRTLQFRLNISAVQLALDSLNCRLDAAELTDGASELPDGSGETAGTIPETTTQTTTEKSTGSGDPATASVFDPQVGKSVGGELPPEVPSKEKGRKQDVPADYTALERYLCEVTGRSRLSEPARGTLRTPARSETYEHVPSPNELFEDEEEGLSFRAWSAEPVLEWWEKQSKGNTLVLARGIRKYDWYVRWRDEEDEFVGDATAAARRYGVEMNTDLNANLSPDDMPSFDWSKHQQEVNDR
jgi:hypothetical protein